MFILEIIIESLNTENVAKTVGFSHFLHSFLFNYWLNLGVFDGFFKIAWTKAGQDPAFSMQKPLGSAHSWAWNVETAFLVFRAN